MGTAELIEAVRREWAMWDARIARLDEAALLRPTKQESFEVVTNRKLFGADLDFIRIANRGFAKRHRIVETGPCLIEVSNLRIAADGDRTTLHGQFTEQSE